MTSAPVDAHPFAARYAVKTCLGGVGGQPMVKPFATMAELVEWVRFNNMAFGTPRPFTAYFSAEHADGSPLDDAERAILADEGSMDAYLERQRSATGMFYATTPEAGEAHALVSRAINAIRR